MNKKRPTVKRPTSKKGQPKPQPLPVGGKSKAPYRWSKQGHGPGFGA